MAANQVPNNSEIQRSWPSASPEQGSPPDLWAIARFFDGALADEISRPDGRLSWDTSPAVAFLPGETTKLQLADGSTLLVEDEPTHIDHLALVTSDAGEAGGVWSRGIVNTGIAKILQIEHA